MPVASFDPLRDGFATLITLASIPAVKLYEKEVTAPAVDSGGAIESTHMRREIWRMKDPKALKTLGDMTAVVFYKTNAYNDVLLIVGEVTTITLEWPDGATLSFFGFVDKITPSGNSEGNQPTATLIIVPTLYDPETGLEAVPNFIAAA